MSPTQVVLLIAGALFEFLGIILAVAPDVMPQGIRFSRWLRTRTRSQFDRIRRLLWRRPSVVKLGLVTEVNMAGRIRPITSASPDWPLERRVEFLLARDQQAQRDIHALRERIEDFEIASSERLHESRREIEARFNERLTKALEAYRPVRILGAVALFIGLVCMTLANFVR